MNCTCKVGSYVVTLFDWTPIIELHIVRLGFKYKYQRDTCYDGIRLHAQTKYINQ